MNIIIRFGKIAGSCATAVVRLRGVVAALALLGLATATGAHAQRLNQQIEVGAWTILNLPNPQGESAGCLAMTTFNDRGVLGIMSDGSFAALYVSQPRQGLTPGTSYDVAFSYDGGRWIRATGEAGSDGIMSIIIPGSVDATLRTFADMDDIEIQMPNNTAVSRSLSGSGAAVAALRRCVQNARPR